MHPTDTFSTLTPNITSSRWENLILRLVSLIQGYRFRVSKCERSCSPCEQESEVNTLESAYTLHQCPDLERGLI